MVKDGRAFVRCILRIYFNRPSGTEDVVRIYAEASSHQDVDEMIESIEQLLRCY